MSTETYQGKVAAFRRLMQLAAEEITQPNGEIKRAKPIWTEADPHKLTIWNPRALRILKRRA